MIVKKEGYLFESTGRFSRNYGTADIGINVHADIKDNKNLNLVVVQGYDQSWEFETNHKGCKHSHFTPEERIELADFMIEKWTQFKNI